jgi:hypothetical protein
LLQDFADRASLKRVANKRMKDCREMHSGSKRARWRKSSEYLHVAKVSHQEDLD